MDYRKSLVLVAVVSVAVLLVFVADAYEKQTTEDRVLRLQIETNKELGSGEIVRETEEIVIYDQDDLEEIEGKLRELGYIE